MGGAQGGRVYPLSHNTALIGRSELADICVSDPSVSSQHARIINGSHGFEIEDLGSTNGTFVEGQRVTRARLGSGDGIIFGQIEVRSLCRSSRRPLGTMTIIPAALPSREERRVLDALPAAGARRSAHQRADVRSRRQSATTKKGSLSRSSSVASPSRTGSFSETSGSLPTSHCVGAAVGGDLGRSGCRRPVAPSAS